MSLDSILATVDCPTIDRSTRQFALAQHHVLSSPLSLVPSFEPRYTVLLERPPVAPYQVSSIVNEYAQLEPAQPRRKRRRVVEAQDRSPLDWINLRSKQEQQRRPDKAEQEQHETLVPLLGTAIQILRDQLPSNEQSWLGKLNDNVCWVDQCHKERLEMPLTDSVAAHLPSELGSASKTLLNTRDLDQPVEISHLVNRIVANTDNDFAELDISFPAHENNQSRPKKEDKDHARVALPPHSAFVLSEFATWTRPALGVAQLGKEHGGWDVLILDPPWPNASVARASQYDMFDPYALGKMDLSYLVGDGPTMVACWVTNRVKYRKLVTDKLMPSWGIKQVAEMYWVKSTSHGEPVWLLDGSHRRCYEGES
ncbi:hypothetical protein OIO90_001147 [Microbotryomycetes sp. JL221]|nr:hypothetical protein OIO90_001147 [Microbotryomycetes sp. JL221]